MEQSQKTRLFKKLFTSVLSMLMLGGLATFGAATASATTSTPAPVQRTVEAHYVEGVRTNADVTSLEELFALPGPMHGTMSGTEVIEVWVGSRPTTRAITTHSTCGSGRLCLWAESVPYADYGFSGTGSASGTWSHRGGWDTGNLEGRVYVKQDANQAGGWTAWWPAGWSWNFNYMNTTVTSIERR